MKTLDARTLGVDAVIRAVDRPPSAVPADVTGAVDRIIAEVRGRGDGALLEYTARFDGFGPATAAGLAIPPGDFEAAEKTIEPTVRAALAYAAERIERYHAAALPKSWRMTDEHGSVLGQDVRPLDRVGIYIPGGRAAYPSTVLMTAVPARVAGVREIVLVTPPGRDGAVPAAVLAAARIAGVTEGWRIGGAQAIAALAYGTPTIRRVDKIVGPGNIYVALAKSKVFGDVGNRHGRRTERGRGRGRPPRGSRTGRRRPAGAGRARSDGALAADHRRARAAAARAGRARRSAGETVAPGHRRPSRSAANGAFILVADLEAAVDVANRLAPEHLELMVDVPAALLPRVRSAGAVFLGAHTPEVVGDYVAGPNHVLPTAGTARFASPLGTDDFVKRSSVLEYSAAGPRGGAAAPERAGARRGARRSRPGGGDTDGSGRGSPARAPLDQEAKR